MSHRVILYSTFLLTDCVLRVVTGITPYITNEVGVNCDELTFQDGAKMNPKAALAASHKRGALTGSYLT